MESLIWFKMRSSIGDLSMLYVKLKSTGYPGLASSESCKWGLEVLPAKIYIYGLVIALSHEPAVSSLFSN